LRSKPSKNPSSISVGPVFSAASGQIADIQSSEGFQSLCDRPSICDYTDVSCTAIAACSLSDLSTDSITSASGDQRDARPLLCEQQRHRTTRSDRPRRSMLLCYPVACFLQVLLPANNHLAAGALCLLDVERPSFHLDQILELPPSIIKFVRFSETRIQ
jgi:hypothetical protein